MKTLLVSLTLLLAASPAFAGQKRGNNTNVNINPSSASAFQSTKVLNRTELDSILQSGSNSSSTSGLQNTVDFGGSNTKIDGDFFLGLPGVPDLLNVNFNNNPGATFKCGTAEATLSYVGGESDGWGVWVVQNSSSETAGDMPEMPQAYARAYHKAQLLCLTTEIVKYLNSLPYLTIEEKEAHTGYLRQSIIRLMQDVSPAISEDWLD